MHVLHEVEATNFLSFKRAKVSLGRFSVLVGPNGSGKSNLLEIFRFLGDIARTDLIPAVQKAGGFERILFRGVRDSNSVKIVLKGAFTRHASLGAPDEYSINFWRQPRILMGTYMFRRTEAFTFKRVGGKGRRLSLNGANLQVFDEGGAQGTEKLQIDAQSAGLSTLRRLGKAYEAEQVEQLATLLENLRVFDIAVDRARRPSGMVDPQRLHENADNLAAFLLWLRDAHAEVFEMIEEDLRFVVPSVKKLGVRKIGGASEQAVVEVTEAGLDGVTPLSAASFGTIRALSLFAMMHDPEPPLLSCIEEIDHGLHLHALDRIVDRLREASERTQIIVATHSPAFVNRLDPSELVVFERDPVGGGTRLPVIDPAQVRRMQEASGLNPGELWFSGLLGGALP